MSAFENMHLIGAIEMYILILIYIPCNLFIWKRVPYRKFQTDYVDNKLIYLWLDIKLFSLLEACVRCLQFSILHLTATRCWFNFVCCWPHTTCKSVSSLSECLYGICCMKLGIYMIYTTQKVTEFYKKCKLQLCHIQVLKLELNVKVSVQ